MVPIVRNVGVANHDHGIQSIAFHHDGRLLLCSGGVTNAGVAGPGFGGIDVRPPPFPMHPMFPKPEIVINDSPYVSSNYINVTLNIFRACRGSGE